MLALLPTLLLAAAPAAPPPTLPHATRAGLEVRAAALAKLPLGWVRVREASAAFLGTPYRLSPLGEGRGIDSDPRLRLDAVDCLTFVETSLALAEARSLDEVLPILDDIRYAENSAPDFQRRLHLMEAQWIPALIRKGYAEEATRRYGGDRVIELEIAYDEASWKKRRHLAALSWDPALEGLHRVPTIPLEAAVELAPSLPEGLIVNVVREQRPGEITLITHTGFLVIRDGVRYVRHAALGERRVIDEPLDSFLRRHARMRQRRVVGIHLLSVRSNAERVQRLFPAEPVLVRD